LHEFENGLGVEGCGNGLVAVAVADVVGVGGTEHVVAVAAAVVVARCTILGIDVVPTWIVHEIALANVDASRVMCVLVVAAAVVVVVVGGAGFTVAVGIGIGIEGVGDVAGIVFEIAVAVARGGVSVVVAISCLRHQLVLEFGGYSIWLWFLLVG